MAIDHDQARSDATEASDLTRSLKLVAIALASAAVTATLVIAVGGAWLDRQQRGAALPAEPAALIRTTG